MAELYRYAAFISYSSKDAVFARRLHRALESYGIPSSLGKFDLVGGGKKNRIYPVFRDREELSAGHLGDQIEANLKASAALIVVCSPNGAASPWVQKEIEFFAAQGRQGKIFAIIPDTAPLADETGADCTQSCFPPAFRGDALSGDKLEPLAADARKGKDGFRNAWLKIVAGMIGVSPGQIIDRDRRRRAQQQARTVVLSAVGVLVAGVSIATVAERDWRSMLLRTAIDSSGHPLDELPYALAAAPQPGTALPLQTDRVNAIFERVLPAPVLMELGATEDWYLAHDGSVIFAQTVSGASVILGIRSQTMRDLGVLPVEARVSLSDDGAVLSVAARDGSLSLWRASERPQLSVENLHHSYLSGDGSMLVTLSQSNILSFYDLRRSTERHVLGGIERPQMWSVTRDGAWFFAHGSSLDIPGPQVTAYDLRGRGRSNALGAIEYIRASDDGSRAIVTYENLEAAAFSLAGGGRKICDLGPVERFREEISRDGSTIVVRRRTGEVVVFDVEANCASREVGRVEGDITLSEDGSTLAAWKSSDVAVVYSLTGERSPREIRVPPQMLRPDLDIRENASLRLSAEGWGLVIVGHGSQGVEPTLLYRGDSGRTVDLGPLRGSTFYGDALFAINEGGEALLLHRANDEVRNFGLNRGYMLSSDGAILAMRGDDGRLSVFDLSTAFERRTRTDICDAMQHQVRPLALAGRPRNPCDWRGLLAIFPNAERGDGWFEGARQWLRLMHVRHFGGAEYACEETTSAASAETRGRRRDICERFAVPQATAEPS